MRGPALAFGLAVACAAGGVTGENALAQTSANYHLAESTFNAGGDPNQGVTLASASHHVKLDALGDAALGVGLASASYRMDAGFVDVYRPPGEVLGLTVAADKKTFNWNPERSVGSYDLYRDLLSTLPGNFGTCLASSIAANTWTDATTPPAGRGWFYLATAKNRLGEEGTKGARSNGAERPNPAPCP